MVSHFPRTTRRQVVAVITAIAALLGAAVPLAMADNLKDRKHAVEKKLSHAKDDLDESSAAVRRATQGLLDARAALSTAQDKLAVTRTELAAAQLVDEQMQAKLDLAEARLDQAQSDLSDGRRQVAEQARALALIAIDHYEGGDPSLVGLTVVFSGAEPAEITSQLESMHSVMDKEQSMYDELAAAKVLLKLQKDEVQVARDGVAEQRAEAAKHLTVMQKLEAQAEAQTQEVAALVTQRQQAQVTALQAKKLALREVLKLRKERERIKKLILEKASQGGKYTGPGGGNGFLNMPVQGTITSPYGYRTHPIYGYYSLHDGIDIAADCGTPIRASAAGKVIAEYYNSAWGNRIIIDHGIHYNVGLSTISNHLSSYAVSVGERVQRGQIIGYVGTTGWSTGCHLHWTVNENGNPVDPMKWL